MKKLLAALLLSVSTVVSAQTVDPNTGTVSVTPNVIDPSLWTPIIPLNSSQLGQIEGAGGGPIPAINTDTNTIRFSFMPYTVSQVRAIEQVLSGNGIKVSGFNYSWQIYNDLSSCCGTRGSLSVTGQLADKSGNVLESYFENYSNFNTGAQFVTFSGTENFSKSYNLETLGYVGLAWTGQDQNFWSGYYGPRVRNTSLTLNYSVGSTSPSTPTTPTTNTTVAGVPTATDIATAASLPPPEAEPAPPPAPTTSSTSEPSSTGAPPPPPGSEPPPGSPPPPSSSTTSQPAPSGSSQPAPSGSPQPSNSPAPSTSSSPTSVATAGPAQQQQQAGAPSSGPSLSSVLTTIKNNEKKEQAIAQAAVSGANEVAQTAVSATEQTALSVAAMSVTSSQTSSTSNNSSSSSSNDASNSSKSSLTMGIPLVTPNTQTGPLQGSSNLIVSVTSIQGSVAVNQSTQQVATINTQTLQLSQQTQQTQNSQIQLRGPETSEFKTTDDNTVFSNNFLTNRSNPMTEIVENNTKTNTSERNEQPSTTVKTNVQSNDLAGKVDIASIAVVPSGYNLYTGLILKDVAFYAPKEIYRNQVNVDNTRLLRQLASDAKHQQMVNLQYGEKQ
jgi:hypothetical protein